jgi:hypothetical protein
MGPKHWPPAKEITQEHIDRHAFWPSNEQDFLCVHYYLARDLMDEIERLRREIVLQRGGD